MYILKSKFNGQIYVGSTRDLKNRLVEHNNARSISTKRYIPWEVIYYEAYLQEKLARIREKRLKHNGNAIRELKKRIGLLKSGAGFTLIELLVALVLIASFGAIVLNIITSTFRGTSKTDIINKVRENGNYTISEITRTIKYSKTFDGASADGVSNWTCDIVPPPPAPQPIPVQYKAVRSTSFDGLTTTFICNSSSDTPPDTIVSNTISLMDGGPTGSVNISPGTCFFTCEKENVADSPTIGINFTLTSKITSDIAEKHAIIPFTNSIKIRN